MVSVFCEGLIPGRYFVGWGSLFPWSGVFEYWCFRELMIGGIGEGIIGGGGDFADFLRRGEE